MTNTQLVLTKFGAVYDGTSKPTALPALARAAEELDELLSEIDAQAQKQKALSGASLEKAAALQALGDLAHEIASAVHACAAASGNQDLAGRVSYSRLDWSRGADKTIIGRAQNLHEVASSVIDSLVEYGVTPAKLANLQKRIVAFREAHPAPRQRVTASSAATKEIRNLLNQASALLKEQIDRLMVQFMTSTPEFYNAYVSARTVVPPGVRSAETEANLPPETGTASSPLPKAA
jgi:hypothetical protein